MANRQDTSNRSYSRIGNSSGTGMPDGMDQQLECAWCGKSNVSRWLKGHYCSEYCADQGSATNPTPTQQETLEPCWCREDTAYLRVKSHMDHGEFGCRERGRYVYCPNCWACGPTYNTDREAIEGWNISRRATVAGPRGDVIPKEFPDPRHWQPVEENCEACDRGYRLEPDGLHYDDDRGGQTWGICRKVVAATSSPTPASENDQDASMRRIPSLSLIDAIKTAIMTMSDVEHGDPLLSQKAVLGTIEAAASKYFAAAPADNDAESECERFHFLDSHGEEPFIRESDHKRVIERLKSSETGFCWVCRSSHRLIASECRAMDKIA